MRPSTIPEDDEDDDASYGVPSTLDIKKRKIASLMRIKQIENKYKIHATRQLNLNNTLQELEEEAELLANLVGRERKCNLVKNIVPNGVWFVEYLNSRYDPFGLHLDGWTNKCRDIIDDGDLDDTINRLVEKYESQLDLPPELELVGLLCLAGSTVHHNNKQNGHKSMPPPSSRPIVHHPPPKPMVSASSTKLNIPSSSVTAGSSSLGLFGDLTEDLKNVNNTMIQSNNMRKETKKKGVVVNL